MPRPSQRTAALPAPDSAPVPTVSLRERLPARYDAARLPVLVVDHDAGARLLFAGTVGSLGHPVQVAGDAQEARAILARGEAPPRVLVIDTGAPGALALVAALRREPPAAYVYVVALTRIYARAEAERAFSAGADDLLVKPFLIELLAYRLQVAARIIALEDAAVARSRVLEEAARRQREDLAAAVRVQAALLPPRDVALPGLAAAWSYRPSELLAGDLLNLMPLDGDHLAFWVLDVSGHGLPSALLAVQISRFLVPVAGQPSLVCADGAVAPALSVLQALNRLFPMDARTRLYFTICYGVLDLRSGAVDLACAAHPGPFVVHADGTWEQVQTSGVAIGWMAPERARFSSHRLRLAPGDRLYACSDGPIEARDGNGEEFGAARLGALLAGARRRPLAEGLAAVDDAVAAWAAGGEELDDCALLALAFTPGWCAAAVPGTAACASPGSRSPSVARC